MRAILILSPIFSTALLLAACGGDTDADANATLAAENAAGLAGDVVELPGGEGGEVEAAGDAALTDGWVGRWVGVEGMFLEVARGDAPGRYRLTMQSSLDDRGTYDGEARDGGIAFTRPDGAQMLRASDGTATGLKYLDGKQDCLTVKAGEGYCRD